MPLVLADRVNETTTTTGTGTLTLAGAVSGYQSFAVIGNGNTTYYTIVHQTTSEWEVGIGTYTASGTTLARNTVLASSNSGSLVNFSAGTKFVFCDYPAGRAVYLDTATNATIPGLTLSGGTANGVAYLDGSKVVTSGSALVFDGTNLGVGTASPAKLLDVAGDAFINGLLAGRGAGNFANNTAFGSNALDSNTTGQHNTALGSNALTNNTGFNNTAVGSEALRNNTGGGGNVAIGFNALQINSSGNFNIAVGMSSLTFNSSGANNIAVGYAAATANTTGTQNTVVGYNAFAQNSTGPNNVAVGAEAGTNIAAGTGNTSATGSVYLGTGTRSSASGNSNEIVIGTDAIGIGSNSAILGNSSITATRLQGRVGIGMNPTGSANVTGLFVRAGSSQSTNNLFEVQNNAGSVLASVSSTGSVTVADLNATSIVNGLGAVGTPSYTFTGDLNTGMWSPSGDIVAWSTAGSERMRITASGNVGIGTTTPGVLLEVNGAMTAQGNIFAASGGTTRTITLGPAGAGLEYNTDGTTYLGGRTDAYPLVFRTNSAERLRITSGGNVGIGTANPEGRLHVEGGAGAAGSQLWVSTYAGYTAPAAGNAAFPGGAKIVLWNDTFTPQKASIGMDESADIWFNNAGGQAGSGFTFYTGNGASATPAARLKIAKDGNVGIGITTPQSRLDVAVGSTAAPTVKGALRVLGGNTVAEGGIELLNSSFSQGYGWRVFAPDLTGGNTPLVFSARNNNATWTERVRIDTAGNVGIGTTSPSQRLHVNGSTIIPVANSYFTYDVRFGIGTPDSSGLQIFTGDDIRFGSRTLGGVFTDRMKLDVNGNLGIGTAGPLYRLDVNGTTTNLFQLKTTASSTYNRFESSSRTWALSMGNYFTVQDETSAATRMYIDPSGNLGIGTIPSAWRSGARALQLGANGYVSLFEQSNGAANLTFAAYESATNTFAYRTTGDAPTIYSQVGGVHTWSNAIAGTAGNTFSFTERMRLDSSGNLGIGTASPAAKLHVSDAGAAGLEINPTGGAGGGPTISTYNRGTSAYTPLTTYSSAITWYANGSTRAMDLNSSGNLGIGTASPEQKLHVAGGGNTYLATQRTAASTSALVMGSESGKNSIYSWTTPTGATGVPLGFTIGGTEVINLDASANATIGGGTLATSATDGFLYVPTCAGTPTGTPTTKTGFAPIVVDTTNNKMYFYSGGAWRDAGP